MKDAEQIFLISGMSCLDCARSIEKGVARLNGVQACTLNYTAATLRVKGDVQEANILARVRELGYVARNQATSPHSEPSDSAPHASMPANTSDNFIRFLLQRQETTLALIAAVLMLPGLLFHELLPMLDLDYPLWNLTSIAALLVAGLPVARSALRGLMVNREISINLLMTIAGIGAVVIGAYTEAGLVMTLFAIGEALEGYTMERARNAIRSLLAVAPSAATLLLGAVERQVAVTTLKIGDRILVKPGERLPMDGKVRQGTSAVNQAPITGESMPIDKEVGADVFAGSINGAGALEIEVTNLVNDNTVSRMIRMVEEAEERRAPVQRFVDRFAQLYTPAVVVVALLVATLPPLLFAAPFWNPDANSQGWLYRALELLVIACPCALVISTPVTLVSALSNAARNGVMVKGGAFLETLSRIQAFAFDKTGTLTAGQPTVIRVRSVNCQSGAGQPGTEWCAQCDDLLAWSSAVERRSEHPLAHAVLKAARERNVLEVYPAAEAVQALVGRGVQGIVNGRTLLVGSHAFFDDNITHDGARCAEIQQAASQGQTALLVSMDERYQGYITVADSVRASSQVALQQLKQAGIKTLVMLTGDNAATAQHIANQLGITDVRAELLPEQKVQAIRQLGEQYGTIAMVGDGVNDAPALANASLGIAMGAGSAQALETADMTLMSNDLSKLPFVYQLSRATMRTIRQNVAIALGIKAIFLVVVLFGVGSMWLAVLADVGASLLVTLNGLRLLRFAR